MIQSGESVRDAVVVLGANAIYTRDPLQRFPRDTPAINQHFSFNFDIAGSAFGTVAMGGKYANPLRELRIEAGFRPRIIFANRRGAHCIVVA